MATCRVRALKNHRDFGSDVVVDASSAKTHPPISTNLKKKCSAAHSGQDFPRIARPTTWPPRPDYTRAYSYCERFDVRVRTISFLIGIHVINRVTDVLIDGVTCYIRVVHARLHGNVDAHLPTVVVYVVLFSIPKRRGVTNGHHSMSAGDEIGKMKWILCGVLMIGFLFCGNFRSPIIVRTPLWRWEDASIRTRTRIRFRWGDETWIGRKSTGKIRIRKVCFVLFFLFSKCVSNTIVRDQRSLLRCTFGTYFHWPRIQERLWFFACVGANMFRYITLKIVIKPVSKCKI